MREEDSSSQRDNLYISRLESCSGNKIKIIVSNGDIILVLKDIIITNNIFEGKEVSEQDCIGIKHVSDLLEAEKKALSLLSYRQHSRKSLTLKLIKRGVATSTIESVLNKLEDLNYLNDEEFARTWVLSRMQQHPEGTIKLLGGLYNQGIERSLAMTVVEELVPEEKEIDLARIVHKKLTDLGKPEDKIASALTSRGFSYRIIRQVMNMDIE